MKHYYQIKVRLPGNEFNDWIISHLQLRPKRWPSLTLAQSCVKRMRARADGALQRRVKYRIFRITEQEIKQ